VGQAPSRNEDSGYALGPDVGRPARV